MNLTFVKLVNLAYVYTTSFHCIDMEIATFIILIIISKINFLRISLESLTYDGVPCTNSFILKLGVHWNVFGLRKFGDYSIIVNDTEEVTRKCVRIVRIQIKEARINEVLLYTLYVLCVRKTKVLYFITTSSARRLASRHVCIYSTLDRRNTFGSTAESAGWSTPGTFCIWQVNVIKSLISSFAIAIDGLMHDLHDTSNNAACKLRIYSKYRSCLNAFLCCTISIG